MRIRRPGRLLLAAGLLLASGCVSQGDYDRVLEQNRALRRSLRAAEERIAELTRRLEQQTPGPSRPSGE